MTTSTPGARERLRARQSEVLTEVVAGRVPAGFDERTTTVTGLVLRSKRRRAAVHVAPFLAAVPSLAERFDEFALAHPPAGCAHDDADAFAAWAGAEGLLDDATGPAGLARPAGRARPTTARRGRTGTPSTARRRRRGVGLRHRRGEVDVEGLSTMLVFFAAAVIVVLALIGLVATAGRHQRDPHRRGGDGGGDAGRLRLRRRRQQLRWRRLRRRVRQLAEQTPDQQAGAP